MGLSDKEELGPLTTLTGEVISGQWKVDSKRSLQS
jgi:hypothetical protein